MNSYNQKIKNHYERVWSNVGNSIRWDMGPMTKLSPSFSILEFSPGPRRDTWTYATCGMSQIGDDKAIELHMFSLFEARDLGDVALNYH